VAVSAAAISAAAVLLLQACTGAAVIGMVAAAIGTVVAAIGTVLGIGMAGIGMAAIGTVGIGMVAIGTVIMGTATLMWCSSVASAFHGGGAGVPIIHGVGDIHTGITVTGILMVTGTEMAMATAVHTGTVTGMDMEAILMAATVTAKTARRRTPEWRSYNAG